VRGFPITDASFSIVIPVHNEASILEESVEDLVAGLSHHAEDYEILLCENGSSDGTREIATRLAHRHQRLALLSLPQADYGRAMREGMRCASKDIVIIFDIDHYDLGFLRVCEERLCSHDVVLASKLHREARDQRSFFRRAATLVFSRFLRVAFGLKVHDTHGIKGFRRESIADLVGLCRFTRDIFDTELVIRAERAGLHICEVPINVVERRPSRLHIVKRIPRTITDLLHLRWVLTRDRVSRDRR
jgi:glycosyltransferase involved in cell wall biosynthesis